LKLRATPSGDAANWGLTVGLHQSPQLSKATVFKGISKSKKGLNHGRLKSQGNIDKDALAPEGV